MLVKLKNKLSGNKKNIVKISSGTLIGQLISFFTLPLITRIYGVEILGLWAIYNSYSTIIRSFSDFGLTNSIMVETDENIETTYKVITTLTAIISMLSAVIISLYFGIFSNMNKLNILFVFIYLVFIFFTTQQIQICYTWLNRKGMYNILMKNPLITSSSYGITAIVLGLLGMNLYGYFVGYMLGQLITLFHMKRSLPKKMFTFKWSDFKKTFSNNKRFVYYQTPTNLISNFKNQLPVLLIKGLWGTEILGYYSVTIRLLEIPSTLLARAIGRVFFNTVSEMKREGKEIGKFVYNNITRGMKVGALPMILLLAFGDVAAIIFLGPSWDIAGDFVRILTLQYFFMFLMNTVQGLSITLDKQHYAMISSVFQIVGFSVGAVVGKYIFNNIYIGLALMSSAFIIINIVYFSFLFRTMNISVKKYITSVIISILVIVGCSMTIRWSFDKLGIVSYLINIFQ